MYLGSCSEHTAYHDSGSNMELGCLTFGNRKQRVNRKLPLSPKITLKATPR